VFRFGFRGGADERRIRVASIAAACVLVIALFWRQLMAAVILAVQNDRYIQIVGGPMLCVALLYWKRDSIFTEARFSPRPALPVLAALFIACFIWVMVQPPGTDLGALMAVVPVILLIWITTFLLCYGPLTFRRALYALACLAIAIPVPSAWLDDVSSGFQQGSAAVCYAVLTLIGVPVLRNGMVFSLPGLDFQIAPECSGIRSALAFIMVALLAGGLFLRSGWRRAILIAATIPIAIFKNAVRIVVITTLGAYVDRSFIEGPFHHQYGGLIFGPLDIALFIPVLMGLQRLDRRSSQPAAPRVPEHAASSTA